MGMLQLYNADARGVAGTRICPLPDCTDAPVRRQINGEYSLTATFPRGARFTDELLVGRAIKAKVNELGDEQLFVVKRRRRSLTGGMTVYAEHQSYYYNGVILRGGGASSSGTPSLNFNQLYNSAHPSITDLATFTFSRSSNPATIVPMVSTPTCLRTLLLQWLIETHGGEMVFDGFNVEWVDQMGADRGAVYRYGANLTEMEAEDIVEDYASGIFPFWGSIDPKSNVGLVTIADWTLDFPGTWPIQVIKTVDLTSKFDAQPSQADLLTAAQKWMAVNAPTGIPVSIRASRAKLPADTPVDLGDTVTVVNTPWGISQKTRIFALTFDALRERVKDCEFGTINPGFYGAVKNTK